MKYQSNPPLNLLQPVSTWQLSQGGGEDFWANDFINYIFKTSCLLSGGPAPNKALAPGGRGMGHIIFSEILLCCFRYEGKIHY